MLRRLLHSVALVVFVCAPGFADIIQSQNFAFGLDSAINLVGAPAAATDSKFLAVDLQQAMTQGSGLLAVQNAGFGQATLPATNGISLIAASLGSVAGGVQFPTAVISPFSGGQLSLPGSLPLGITIRP
ncbi:MAG: hypothetical protein JW955_02240 [Sedimentisphaerales bacterium]|nr:hypothetical protein [Sedimentisphaerales bacterium]